MNIKDTHTYRGSPSYSYTGKPSIDPVVLVKMLLIGYIFDIRSEGKLIEEITLNLAYRWYIGYDLDEEIPDHGIFSKARTRFGKKDFHEKIVEKPAWIAADSKYGAQECLAYLQNKNIKTAIIYESGTNRPGYFFKNDFTYDMARVRFRGLAKVEMQFLLTASALNLKKVVKMWEKRVKISQFSKLFSNLLQAFKNIFKNSIQEFEFQLP